MSDFVNGIMQSTTVEVECSYGKEIVLSELYERIYQKGREDAIQWMLANCYVECDLCENDRYCGTDYIDCAEIFLEEMRKEN